MRRLVGLGALAAATAWLVVTAGPTFGQQSPTGTLTATVIANAGPCISIDPASFSYAAAQFSTSSSVVTTLPSSTRPTVTNCSNQTSTISARGGQATGTTANWTLQGAPLNCSEGANNYRHELVQSGGAGTIALTTNNQTWESAVPGTGSTGNTRMVNGILTMPCTGSTGAGETTSIPIVLTATTQ